MEKIFKRDEPKTPFIFAGSEIICPYCDRKILAVFKDIFSNAKELMEGKGLIICSKCKGRIPFKPDFEKLKNCENVIILMEAENNNG